MPRHSQKKDKQEDVYVDPKEENVGIQILGEDENIIAEAATVAQNFNPKFVDINMGCPVRKVVSRVEALLLKNQKLSFRSGKVKSPFSIKIRTGWDQDSINAHEVINIASSEGIEFVAIHGEQLKLTELCELGLPESISSNSLPIIGNGDLHTGKKFKKGLIKQIVMLL